MQYGSLEAPFMAAAASHCKWLSHSPRYSSQECSVTHSTICNEIQLVLHVSDVLGAEMAHLKRITAAVIFLTFFKNKKKSCTYANQQPLVSELQVLCLISSHHHLTGKSASLQHLNLERYMALICSSFSGVSEPILMKTHAFLTEN